MINHLKSPKYLPFQSYHPNYKTTNTPSAYVLLRKSQRFDRSHRSFSAKMITVSANNLSPPADIPPDTIIGRRYKVEKVLGRGSNAITYRCHDIDTNHSVAIKALSLRSIKDWKQLELFERESLILKNLDHAAIPRYIDCFEEDTDTDRTFFLVQELAEGSSIEDMVQSGWRADEAEAQRIAAELLRVLQYLGSRRPPVIHRDIKPSNVVIEGGKTGGRVFLVDFGGVQAAAATGAEDFGSTIVGTFGYMSPEQFRGVAGPASDLYSLGAVVLFVLSGRHPSAFPMDRMRIDTSTVPMGRTVEILVECLLEPVAEDRISAETALDILEKGLDGNGRDSMDEYYYQNTKRILGNRKRDDIRSTKQRVLGGLVFNKSGPINIQSQSNERQRSSSMNTRSRQPQTGSLRKPPGSRVTVSRRGPRLLVDIPPAGWSSSTAASGAFAVSWNAFVAFWTVSALAGGGIIMALFSLPFWFAGASLLKQTLGRHFMRERIEIDAASWRIQKQVAAANVKNDNKPDWSKGSKKESSGKTRDLREACFAVVAYVNGEPQGQLVLQHGAETYPIGEGLDVVEQEWLEAVINNHLEELLTAKLHDDDDNKSIVEIEESNSPSPPSYNKREFDDFDRRLIRSNAKEKSNEPSVAATRRTLPLSRTSSNSTIDVEEYDVLE